MAGDRLAAKTFPSLFIYVQPALPLSKMDKNQIVLKNVELN